MPQWIWREITVSDAKSNHVAQFPYSAEQSLIIQTEGRLTERRMDPQKSYSFALQLNVLALQKIFCVDEKARKSIGQAEESCRPVLPSRQLHSSKSTT